MIDIFESEVLACETHVELFNGFALQHLGHVDLLALVEHFALDQRIAQAAGQVLAEHTVQIGFLDAFATCEWKKPENV